MHTRSPRALEEDRQAQIFKAGKSDRPISPASAIPSTYPNHPRETPRRLSGFLSGEETMSFHLGFAQAGELMTSLPSLAAPEKRRWAV